MVAWFTKPSCSQKLPKLVQGPQTNVQEQDHSDFVLLLFRMRTGNQKQEIKLDSQGQACQLSAHTWMLTRSDSYSLENQN